MRPSARGARARRLRRNAAIPLLALASLAMSACVTVPADRVVDPAAARPTVGFPGAWYPGDLHSHSTHSDGDSPVAAIIASAEARLLSFFALTDHDTSMGGAPTHWSDPDYASDRMILLYGVEWTSRQGHANVIAAAPFDYSALWRANRDLSAADAIAAARSAGAVFSINHPGRPGGSWAHPYTDAEGAFAADALEVWNAPFLIPSRNRAAVSLIWDGLLRAGLEVTGVGGSDNHHLRGLQRSFNPHGAPTTWVFSAEPTGEAILDAIRAGRVSISYSPAAPRLELLADADGDGRFEAMMGDRIPAGRQTTFAVGLARPDDQPGRRYLVTVFKNGRLFARFRLREGHTERVTFTDVPASGDYYRAELEGTPQVGPLRRLTMGRTLALTNPVYARE